MMAAVPSLKVKAAVSPSSDSIIIEPFFKNKPVIKMTHIHISCESDPYQADHEYAGFILYAHGDDPVKTDWCLNGKRCKNGYLVIQESNKPEVQRYVGQAEGQIHGAVYKNVFGEDVGKAVGEAFSYDEHGKFQWHSLAFNTPSDDYHGEGNRVSDIIEECLFLVLNEWKKSKGSLPSVRTYELKVVIEQAKFLSECVVA